MKTKNIEIKDYWRSFEIVGFSKMDFISKDEYNKPKLIIYIPISEKMNIDEKSGVPSFDNTIKLVFDFYRKLETGIIYKFRGWEK